MRRVAVIVLVVAACGSKATRDDVVDERVVATGAAGAMQLDRPAREHALGESPAPTCDEVIDRANDLYVASKAGKDLGTQQDVARSMNIHHVCEQMTPKQRRCVMAARTIGETDACELPVAGEPARAQPLPKALTCQDVGEAWSDYLHNGNRKKKDWVEIARDQQSFCERNDWPQAERLCWAAITDAVSHQRCLDDFYKPRVDKHRSKPLPADPEDSILAEDAGDEQRALTAPPAPSPTSECSPPPS